MQLHAAAERRGAAAGQDARHSIRNDCICGCGLQANRYFKRTEFARDALRRAYARLFLWFRLLTKPFHFRRARRSSSSKGGASFVSGFIPQMEAADVRGRDRTAARDRYAARAVTVRAAEPRLPVHRHARHGQNHLREDTRARGQLRAPGKRRPLRRMSLLPRNTGRLGAGRDRDRRCLQQRCGQHP